MKVFPYEGIYVGLVQVFHATPAEATLDIELAVSRDSVHFTRLRDRRPFIELAPVGSWDRFNLSLANNDPIAVGDDLRFYYGGRMYRHGPYSGPDKGPEKSGIGFASIKRDRFVALESSFDGGEIVLKPLKVEGSSLRLNAKADFGEVVVEMLTTDGKRLGESKPIQRDGLDIPVEWQGATPRPDGAVTLRILLKNALAASCNDALIRTPKDSEFI